MPLAGVQRHAVPLARDPHENGPRAAPGQLGCHHPNEPRGASLDAAIASRDRWSSEPLAVLPPRASGQWEGHMAISRRASVRRWVCCSCGRPDTRRCGRRASLQPPPAGRSVRGVAPVVVDPRLAQPLAEASSVARRLSRTRPRDAEANPWTAVITRCTILPERRRRLRRPLSSVIPDIGKVASARHRCCIAPPSSGPVHRQERPKSLSPSPGPSHGVRGRSTRTGAHGARH